MKPFPRYLTSEHGASAVEFALVVPILMFLVFGSIYFALLMYATVSLHQATEAAVRYASVQIAANGGTAPSNLSSSSSTSGSVAYYGVTHYFGPGINPTFTYTTSTTGCATSTAGTGTSNKVVGTGTFVLIGGIKNASISLSATACRA